MRTNQSTSQNSKQYLSRGLVAPGGSKSSIHEEFQKFENFRGRAQQYKLVKRLDSSSSSSSSDSGGGARNAGKKAKPQHQKELNKEELDERGKPGQQQRRGGKTMPEPDEVSDDEDEGDDPDFNMRQSILQHSLHGKTDEAQQQMYMAGLEDFLMEPERDGATSKAHQRKGKSKERRDDSIYICNAIQSPIKYDALSRNIPTQQTSQTTQQYDTTDKMTQRSVVHASSGPQQTPNFHEQTKERSHTVEDAIQVQKELDEQFVILMLQVEERYQQNLEKRHRKQVELWSKALCQIIQPQGKDVEFLVQLRRSRNLYAVKLLDQILSLKCLEDEFLRMPPKSILDLEYLDHLETQRGLSKRFQQAVKDLNPYGHGLLKDDSQQETKQSSIQAKGRANANFLAPPKTSATPQLQLKPPKLNTSKDISQPLPAGPDQAQNGGKKSSSLSGNFSKLKQSKSPRVEEGSKSTGISLQMIPTKLANKQGRAASTMSSRGGKEKEAPKNSASVIDEQNQMLDDMHAEQQQTKASMVHLEQQMTSLHQTIGHQKLQIENLEAFITKKQAQSQEQKQQIKELSQQLAEKDAEHQKSSDAHAKDKKYYEKQEREAKLREALVLKQTDIIDNITRQLHKAADDKFVLKQQLEDTLEREAELSKRLERIESEARERDGVREGYEEALKQVERLDELLERRERELAKKDEEIKDLDREKQALKSKNLKYQELSEKLLQQLEERDCEEEESRDRRVDLVRCEMEEEHQAAIDDLKRQHEAEMQELEQRLIAQFQSQLQSKDQEIDQMRDDYIKISDELKRKDSQMVYLENRLQELQQNANQAQNYLPVASTVENTAVHEHEESQHPGTQLPNPPPPAQDLTKSELIIQRCENYIQKKTTRERSTQRGDPATTCNQSHRVVQNGYQSHQPQQVQLQENLAHYQANQSQLQPPIHNQSLLVRQSSSELQEDRFYNVEQHQQAHKLAEKNHSRIQHQQHYDRQSNRSQLSHNSRASSNGPPNNNLPINRSIIQQQHPGTTAVNNTHAMNDSKIVSSSQVLIGALAAMNHKERNGQGGGNGIPPLNHHNLSQLNIQENNYVPTKTQNVQPKSTRSSNPVYDDSGRHGVKDLIGGGGAISGISQVASSVNVSQLNPNLSVHKSVQGLPSGLPPKALQMTNTSQVFSNNQVTASHNYQKTLKEMYNSMTSQQQQQHVQNQQQLNYSNVNQTSQTHILTAPAPGSRIERAHQDLEDTSNFEKTMPSPPYKCGASNANDERRPSNVQEGIELPNNIHGEHTQKLIRDIRGVGQRKERRAVNEDGDDAMKAADRSQMGYEESEQATRSQYGPITATQSVQNSQNNMMSATMVQQVEENAIDEVGNQQQHQKRYSQFEQRQDIQTYRTLCQEDDEDTEIIDDLGQTDGDTIPSTDPHGHLVPPVHPNDRHHQTQDSSDYLESYQNHSYNLKVPMPPNGMIPAGQPSARSHRKEGQRVEHKRQGFQLNLGQVNQAEYGNQPIGSGNQVGNNGQSTARGAYQQFQGARQVSSRLHSYRKEESSRGANGHSSYNDRGQSSSALGAAEGVRSNDRYDRLYDELINEEDLANEQHQQQVYGQPNSQQVPLNRNKPSSRQAVQQANHPAAQSNSDQQFSPDAYYDTFTQGRTPQQQPGRDVNQSDLDIQRHLYAIQQRHNQVEPVDMMSESDFASSRHQANMTSAQHCSTNSVTQTDRKIRGAESTASRQLRLIQNRYAKQSANILDDYDQFEQIIDEEEQEMQSSSRDSHLYKNRHLDGGNNMARDNLVFEQPAIMDDYAGRQTRGQPPSVEDEDEDLFKLSQFLTKRGNQNSIDQSRQTANNSQASQKTASAGHHAGAPISMRNIESQNAQEAYGCLSSAAGAPVPSNRPSSFQNQVPPSGSSIQMTESMMKSKFRPSGKNLEADKSPLYCPDTVDKKFDKFVDDLL